jgi:SAM-dependent methyltransferase
MNFFGFGRRASSMGADSPIVQIPRAEAFIDVKRLIAEMPDSELLAAADAYFAGLTPQSEQCLKPFSNFGDAIHLTRNLSLLLQSADLFAGADVVDFGCATGWLTLALAQMGCAATGLDVSPAALALANELKKRALDRPPGSSTFACYDGHRIPLADASMDRILCFDSFHHVKDQLGTLAEFARVLRPGGRVAMLEPGPEHSMTAKSQEEMSNFKVIENDVDMRIISSHAVSVGLSKPQMLLQLHAPLYLAVDDFLRLSTAPAGPNSAPTHLVSQVRHGITDTQCFFMCKDGGNSLDSRHPGDLQATVRLVSVTPASDEDRSAQFLLEIVNTGPGAWITEQGRIGQVTLGCQKIDQASRIVDRDFLRFPIAQRGVAPGAAVSMVARVPGHLLDGSGLRFEPVSEHICWFSEINGNQPAIWWPNST